jgi:chemosensory pili system protein ChpA (sensor histidine kinase/response regulator)
MSSEPPSLSSPLIWLRSEIDRSLGVARTALAQSVSEPSGRATNLHTCENQVRQVRGAVHILGLNGAARFCYALEAAVNCCAHAAEKLTHVTASIIDRAMFALSQFLDDIAKGESDVPLKLFPLYRELGELSGRTEVLEIELFYPDLGLTPPAHPATKKIADADIPKYVAACRAHYQRFLLLWVNEPEKPDGLHGMRAALDALDQVAAQLATPVGFWWAGVGLVEAVIQRDTRVLELPIKAVFERTERLMQDIESGSAVDSDELMREVLYPLALSAPVSRRVRDAKQVYQLDEQLPEFCVSGTLEYDLAAMTPALDDMRRRLTSLEEAWVLYTAGSVDGLRRLRDETNALKNIARDLGFYRLVRLLDVIQLIASKLPEPYPSGNEVLALEMAAALLFMERMLEQFVSPPPNLDQQVTVMVGWLLDAVNPRAPGAPKIGAPRDDITQRQSYAQVRAQVAREILANLHQVEQTIDQIARDPRTREEIINVDTPVRQIAGALKMLGLSRANGVLSTCQHLMKLSVTDDISLTYASLEWVADGLSCLGFYLDQLQRGEQPNEDMLIGFLQRLGRDDARPAGSTGWIPAATDTVESATTADDGDSGEATNNRSAPSVDNARITPERARAEQQPGGMQSDDPNSEELRSIYVEEAHDVLASIAPALERLSRTPGDQGALVELRRAYHTLKGSGRLVGLDTLGDLAAEIEKTADLWLDLDAPATAALLELIGDASEALLTAAQGIETGGAPEASEFAALIARAQALRDTLGDARAQQAEEPRRPITERTAQATSEVAVGDVRLSGSLYQIYLRESKAHLAALDAELTRCECEPDYRVSKTLIRSAHTIKSSSRTTGFVAVADLADALEECLHRFEGEVLGPELLETVWNARDSLSAMLTDIAQQQQPRPANAQRSRLNEILAGAAPAKPAPVADDAPEELDERLLSVFLEEANQLLPEITSDLTRWRSEPRDAQSARSLARALHTLKGSARMAGALRIGELTHAVESRVGTAVESGQCDAATFEVLERDLDQVAEWVDALQNHAAGIETPSQSAAASVQSPALALPTAAAQIRVNSEVLDRLVNQAGEISIARARIEGEMEALKQSLHDLTDSVSRLRTQLRETQIQADSQMQSRMDELQRDDREFDPLELDRYTRLQELTRMMAESLHDVQMIQQTLVNNSSETEAALAQQGRIDRDLQQDLLQLRSMPFGLLSERLQRTVRQTARELGRSVTLTISGENLDVDRSVLQRIGAPLEHMLRNAVVHGIEAPDQRLALDKPESGRISVSLAREANENVIVLTDDGAGLDARMIRLKALKMGLLAPGDAVNDAALHQLIFAPGFSTAPAVTETSGRGVGMDVVRAEVSAIGGRIEVLSEPGAGTTFRIRFPLTLASTQTILVRAGAVYAIPSSLVEQIQELKPDELVSAYEAGSIPWNATDYPLHYLPRLLGQAEQAAEINRHNAVLMLSSGEYRVAIHVDQILRNQEVVLKSIGPQLARVPGVAGATVLGTGQVVLLIDPVRLYAGGRTLPVLGAQLPPKVVSATPPGRHVFVVDDSLTVRRVCERLLTREGYQVSTAKDGVDAIQQMQDVVPDLIIADIEMPRMDGFELTKQLRSDARMKSIPIIIVTSRMAEKHRKRALELGADAFFGKPYDDEDLLARVAELIEPATTAQNAQDQNTVPSESVQGN